MSQKILKAESLKDKYTTESAVGIDLNILAAFQRFLDDEQFEDEQVEEEFNGTEEDSFFLDWLRDDANIAEGAEALSIIWKDLVEAFKAEETPEDELTYYWSKSKEVKNFNIKVEQSALGALDKQMDAQAQCLKAADHGDVDKATLSILQIGRQNSMPLFMWLADAFNRYRLQRRKYYKEKYVRAKDFENHFEDKTVLEFVQHKCKGFEEWLKEHSVKERTRFMEKCQSAISVYFRRILIMPPMVSRRAPDTLIEDSLQRIYEYILQMYWLVDGLCLREDVVKKQALGIMPYQLDVVIMPRGSVRTDDDEDEDEYDDEKNEGEGEIGSIEERLEGEDFKSEDVEWNKAARQVKPRVEELVKNQKFQRTVLVIDRRNQGQDKCFIYKPSEKHECCHFERDQSKFLPESLLVNSRQCLIPGLKEPADNRPISTLSVEMNPSFLTLQFHVYSADETRVYLSYDGWGTRFFIEDLRHYLPEFFVKSEREKAESLFTDAKYEDFKKDYEKTQKMCPDERFEDFYRNLLNEKGGSESAKATGRPH